MDEMLQKMLVSRGAAHSKALVSWSMHLGVRLATSLMEEDLAQPVEKDFEWDRLQAVPAKVMSAMQGMPALPVRRARTKASVNTEASAAQAAGMARTEEQTRNFSVAAARSSDGLGAEEPLGGGGGGLAAMEE